MTHAERRQRRSAAGKKAHATRRAKEAAAVAGTDPSVPAGGAIRRHAEETGQEALLIQTVQWLRYPHRPSEWSIDQRRTLWETIRPVGS